MTLAEKKCSAIRRAYDALANVTVGEMRRLLRGPASVIGALAAPPLEPQAIGRLVALQLKRESELTEADHRLMAEAVVTIRELLEHRPAGDVQRSAWRRKLMYLGHDPLRRRYASQPIGR